MAHAAGWTSDCRLQVYLGLERLSRSVVVRLALCAVRCSVCCRSPVCSWGSCCEAWRSSQPRSYEIMPVNVRDLQAGQGPGCLQLAGAGSAGVAMCRVRLFAANSTRTPRDCLSWPRPRRSRCDRDVARCMALRFENHSPVARVAGWLAPPQVNTGMAGRAAAPVELAPPVAGGKLHNDGAGALRTQHSRVGCGGASRAGLTCCGILPATGHCPCRHCRWTWSRLLKPSGLMRSLQTVLPSLCNHHCPTSSMFLASAPHLLDAGAVNHDPAENGSACGAAPVDGAATVLAGAAEPALPVAMGFKTGKRPAPAHSRHALVLRPCLQYLKRSMLFTVFPVVADRYSIVVNVRGLVCKRHPVCLQTPDT